ncbi:hypothetical protein MPTK1_2g21020 [Marchantia polymorpha subsp. ruderalis]|uniref:Kinesin-like protein n=1 Tax=Marchantia polymorpha TaxID=3197 RepID=A0A2R6X2V8_MARPO|nr:hypothetical protein MARPO_0040s0110 [Marchantia polymorpha]BBN03135.1 hypothetical protein Mp_2g21020 [Marchantia polymorpha subsp. ruderalis]|eukprot:PTQ40440.1 hypothetical protein MARPO_0040s0110 [Marchantia polymorpha]
MGHCRVKVHLRLRPSCRPSTAIHVDHAAHTIRIDVLKQHGGGPPKPYNDQMVFPFDSIIQSSCQEAVFEQCARQVVEDVLGGYNGTILTYGQTGSGKTFTMTGDTKAYAHRGIVPRAVERIFAEKVAKPEAGITVHVSYLEVYNEMSSRSHCVFTMFVERHSGLRTLQEVTSSKLNLVDLAGSERLKRTEVGGTTKKEAMLINKSLSFLEQAVFALRQGLGHVPFRQSRLTTLLKDALGGNCKTVLIVCAWAEDFFLDETISALRFAQRVKYLKTSAVINKKADAANTQRRYVREISELKQELALRDALTGRPSISYDELTEETRSALRERIQAFLAEEAGIDSIPIENFKQVKELFCLFKEAQVSLRGELEKLLRDYGGGPDTFLNHSQHDVDINPGSEEADDEECVGELDKEGFHVGPVAPDNARPDLPTSPHAMLRAIRSPGLKYGEDTLLDYNKAPPAVAPPPNLWELDEDTRNEAFSEFKHTTDEGRTQDHELRTKTAELRLRKQTARELCTTVNDAKLEIANIKKVLDEQSKQSARVEFNNQGFDEQKYHLMQRFREARSAYQRGAQEFKEVKTDLELLQQEVRDCKQKLLESFFRWFEVKTQYKGDLQRLMTPLSPARIASPIGGPKP